MRDTLEVVGLQVLLIGFLGGIVLVYSKNTSVSLPASFYENVGFEQSSDTFMLDGIPHIKMTWTKDLALDQLFFL